MVLIKKQQHRLNKGDIVNYNNERMMVRTSYRSHIILVSQKTSQAYIVNRNIIERTVEE